MPPRQMLTTVPRSRKPPLDEAERTRRSGAAASERSRCSRRAPSRSARHSRESRGAEEATIVGLGLVAALPRAWIGLARLAEKRYLSRPPKRVPRGRPRHRRRVGLRSSPRPSSFFSRSRSRRRRSSRREASWKAAARFCCWSGSPWSGSSRRRPTTCARSEPDGSDAAPVQSRSAVAPAHSLPRRSAPRSRRHAPRLRIRTSLPG